MAATTRYCSTSSRRAKPLATIERAIQDALTVGIEVRLFIILGHPGETLRDVEDSFALAQRYPLIRLHLNNPIPYPGTELFEWVKQNKRFIRQPEDYLNNVTDDDDEPVFDTPELPREVRRQINSRGGPGPTRSVAQSHRTHAGSPASDGARHGRQDVCHQLWPVAFLQEHDLARRHQRHLVPPYDQGLTLLTLCPVA
jgi:hypothetical protein